MADETVSGLEMLANKLVVEADAGRENPDFPAGSYGALLYGPKYLVEEAQDDEVGTLISLGRVDSVHKAIELLAIRIEAACASAPMSFEEVILPNSGCSLKEQGFRKEDFRQWVPAEGEAWLVPYLEKISSHKYLSLIYWWRYLSLIDYVDDLSSCYAEKATELLPGARCIFGVEAAPPAQEYAAYIVEIADPAL